MNRIENKFKQLKKEGRKAFIAFITAGFPDLATSLKLSLALESKGVDLLELGVPFSDPLADGAVIQEASQYSLQKGTNLPKIFKLVRDLRKKTQLPVCLMTYYNPVFCYGEKAFVDQARKSGVDGVIIPDLPYDEALGFNRYCREKGLINICLLSPTTSGKRAKSLLKSARGFVYYVSLTGVTGSRRGLPGDLKSKLAALKKLTSLPVCAGFGISSAGQLKSVQAWADGAIVGSAIVAKIKDNLGKPALIQKVSEFAGRLNV